MLSHSIIVRLPSGTEYWYAAKPPEVGDSIFRRGTQYVVTSCDESEDKRLVVTLEETNGAPDSLPAHPSA